MNSAVFQRAEDHLRRTGLLAADEPLLAFANSAIWRPGTAGVALTDRRLLVIAKRATDREIDLDRLTAYSVAFHPGRLVLRIAIDDEGVSTLEVPGTRRQTTEFLQVLDQQFGSRRPRVDFDEVIDLKAFVGRPLAVLLAHSVRVATLPNTRVLGLLRDEGQGRELLTACHYRVADQDRVATVRFSSDWDGPALRAWLYFLNLTRASETLRDAEVELLAPTLPPSPFAELAHPGPRSAFLPRAVYARRPADPGAATRDLLQLVGSITGSTHAPNATGIRAVVSWVEHHLEPSEHALPELRAVAELLAAAIGTVLVEAGRGEWIVERGRRRSVRLADRVVALEDTVRERLLQDQPLESWLEMLGPPYLPTDVSEASAPHDSRK